MQRTTEFWVGDRLVRPSLGEIQLGPERVHIEPRSMEVLLALAARPSEVIPKQELIAAVWGEAFVSDEVLTHAIWDLRRAFGDNASDPEFIQTIPKKGYRLIAPVKPVGPPRRRATDREPKVEPSPRRTPSVRLIVWGATLIAVLSAAGLWLASRRSRPEGPRPASRSSVLLLLPTTPPAQNGHWAWRLDNRLLSELRGIEDVEIRSAVSCSPVAGFRTTYCLESSLLAGAATQLSLRLTEASARTQLYASPVRQLTTGNEVDVAAGALAEQISAYFEVARNRYASDPDIRPWIAHQKDQVAIRDFLLGVDFVYRHEQGGRKPMDVAIERDPDFVAPRVWRTPQIVGDVAAGRLEEGVLADYRRELTRLYGAATAFEKPMIQWALAIIDGDVPTAVRELRIALGQEPENRPARLILGALLMAQGDLDQAWKSLEPLVEQEWRFPGLYAQAAQCALCRGALGDVRATLASARAIDPVDPGALALLLLLAIFDEDPENEALFGDWLERRKQEMAPEEVRLDIPCVDTLADTAEADGRPETARRLRERTAAWTSSERVRAP